MTWLVDFFGGSYVRAIAALCALAACIAIGLGANAHVKRIGADEARAELAPRLDALTIERDRLDRELRQARADLKANEDASRAYQTELAALRDRPVRRDPVRLCVERPGRSSPIEAAAPGLAGGSAAAGLVHDAAGSDLVPGPDIGPDLRALAGRADRLSAQLRAVIDRCEASP